MFDREGTPKEAVAYLRALGCRRVTVASLATMRSRGGGPQYRKDGRYVLYSERALREWAQKRSSGLLDSTSTPTGGNSTPQLSPDCNVSLNSPDYFNTGDPLFDEVTRLEEERWNVDTVVDDMLKDFDYHKTLNQLKS